MLLNLPLPKQSSPASPPHLCGGMARRREGQGEYTRTGHPLRSVPVPIPLLKRERGECCIHPAVAPVSPKRRELPVVAHTRASGGQNLAALCAAAGQNLAAIGSRHSLPETVDLGTMTLAGLVGTLHLHTPPVKINMLDSRKIRPQRDIITDLTVIPEHYNRKPAAGQSLFSFFPEISPNRRPDMLLLRTSPLKWCGDGRECLWCNPVVEWDAVTTRKPPLEGRWPAPQGGSEG